MRTLVDTNVLSEARRSGGHPGVRQSLASIDPEDLYLSVLTIGELVKGVEKLPDGTRRRELDAWVRQIQEHHADRILPVDLRVARLWGELCARSARTLPAIDAMIAATALRHDLALMTRNVKDFEGTGVRLVDPFADE